MDFLFMGFIVKYIVIFAVSLVIAWVLVPLVKKIAPALGLVDEPSERRIHKIPIPRCGGIAVFLATHIALLVVFLGPWNNLGGTIHLKEWGLIFAGSLLLLLVGLFDDRYEMKSWFKLLGQLAVALLMFFGGFSFGALLHIQLPFIIDMGVTLFWFALLINAFNLIDGMDGACLLIATFFVFELVLSYPVSLALMAVCVMIPFATIYFYGIYKTVWTRSRISQLVVLILQLTAGEVLAFVALLWVTDLTHLQLLVALLLHNLGVIMGIAGIRCSLRVVRDLGAWLRCSIAHDNDTTRSLILGAGENAILYLRQASFADQQKAPRKIVGLVDDNTALHGKVVYGYPVLGNFSHLEEILKRYEVNELIFTHHYSDELRAEILKLKWEYDLLIRDFVFVLRDLDDNGRCAGIVKPYSVEEIDCRNLCSRINHAAAEAECPAEVCVTEPAAD